MSPQQVFRSHHIGWEGLFPWRANCCSEGHRKSSRSLMRFSTEHRVLALVCEALLLPSSLRINFSKDSFIEKDLMAPVDSRGDMSQQELALAVKDTNFIMSSNTVSVASKKEVVISGVSVSLLTQATRDRIRKWSQVVPGKV